MGEKEPKPEESADIIEISPGLIADRSELGDLTPEEWEKIRGTLSGTDDPVHQETREDS